jgi:hypothetical protein
LATVIDHHGWIPAVPLLVELIRNRPFGWWLGGSGAANLLPGEVGSEADIDVGAAVGHFRPTGDIHDRIAREPLRRKADDQVLCGRAVTIYA